MANIFAPKSPNSSKCFHSVKIICQLLFICAFLFELFWTILSVSHWNGQEKSSEDDRDQLLYKSVKYSSLYFGAVVSTAIFIGIIGIIREQKSVLACFAAIITVSMLFQSVDAYCSMGEDSEIFWQKVAGVAHEPVLLMSAVLFFFMARSAHRRVCDMSTYEKNLINSRNQSFGNGTVRNDMKLTENATETNGGVTYTAEPSVVPVTVVVEEAVLVSRIPEAASERKQSLLESNRRQSVPCFDRRQSLVKLRNESFAGIPLKDQEPSGIEKNTEETVLNSEGGIEVAEVDLGRIEKPGPVPDVVFDSVTIKIEEASVPLIHINSLTDLLCEQDSASGEDVTQGSQESQDLLQQTQSDHGEERSSNQVLSDGDDDDKSTASSSNHPPQASFSDRESDNEDVDKANLSTTSTRAASPLVRKLLLCV